MIPPEMNPQQRTAMTAACRDADDIPKVAGAGEVFISESGERLQRMHNGLNVVADGYCGPWMTDLIARCRVHHEPQEERAFHAVVEALGPEATIVEIGGNWSYYSMWFLKGRPARRALIVEPDPFAVELARRHLALNGLSAPVVQGYVGAGYARVAATMREPPPALDLLALLREHGLPRIDLLHCDAQGAEAEIIEMCAPLLRTREIGWLFVSTHGAVISGDPLTHQKCLARLRALGGVIEAEHDVHESFSGDGLIVARFGAPAQSCGFPELSRNRYSTSYYPNPLHELAELRATLRPPPEAPTRTVGVWLELQRASALGAPGERILTPIDKEMLPYLQKHGAWHTEPLDLARQCLDPERAYTLVDIGANIGMFARQFLGAFPHMRSCICVEPDAQNFAALTLNLQKFADRDLRLFPFALGEADATTTFYRDADNIGNYSLNRDAMRNRRFAESQVRTVDAGAFAEAHLGGESRLILKTDTQGSDEAIAVRIPMSVWRRVDFAVMEIWRIEKPPFDRDAFAEIVRSFPHWSFRGAKNPPVEEILEYAGGSDWMFYDLYLWR
jgi:FkbM family methyltransferase